MNESRFVLRRRKKKSSVWKNHLEFLSLDLIAISPVCSFKMGRNIGLTNKELCLWLHSLQKVKKLEITKMVGRCLRTVKNVDNDRGRLRCGFDKGKLSALPHRFESHIAREVIVVFVKLWNFSEWWRKRSDKMYKMSDPKSNGKTCETYN